MRTSTDVRLRVYRAGVKPRRRHDDFAKPAADPTGIREPTPSAADVEKLLAEHLGGRWRTCLTGAGAGFGSAEAS